MANIDYSKIVIYKIISKDLEIKDVYVGSTTNLKKRIGVHKSSYSSKNIYIYNRKIYLTMRKNGGWDNWEFIEIEKYPCLNKNESTLREQYYCELLNATMNSQSANASNKEKIKLGSIERMAKQSEKYKQRTLDEQLGFRRQL